MELDTGAAISVMSEAECAKHFRNANLRPADVKLVTYNGTPVDIKGSIEVVYYDQCFHLALVIAKEAKGARMPALFGRNWPSKIKIRWHEVMQLKALTKELSLTDKYSEVFEPGYGVIKGFKSSIVVKENASPVFCKAR